MDKIHLTAVGISITTFIIAWLICPYGLNLFDEGIPLSGGIRVLNGERVHRDFYGYPTGIYTFYALVFKHLHVDILCVRRVFAVLTVFIPVIAFLVSLRFMPVMFAIIPAVILVFLPGMYCNRFSTIFLLLNLWAHLRFLKGNKINVLILLTCIFVSSLFNVEIGILSLAVLVIHVGYGIIVKHTFASNRTRLIVLGMAVAVFCGSLRIGLGPGFYKPMAKITTFGKQFRIFPGLPWPFHDMFVGKNVKENKIPNNPTGGRKYAFSSLKTKELWFLYFFQITLIVSFVKLIRGYLQGGTYQETGEKTTVLLFYAILGSIPVLMRYGFGYMVRYFGPTYIVVAHLTWVSWNNKRFKTTGILVVAMVLYLLNGVWNHGLDAGSMGVLRDKMEKVDLPRANIVCDVGRARAVTKIVQVIQQLTTKEDYILALPYNPLWYFLAERKNPVYFDWTVPGLVNKSEEKEMINTLAQTPPKIIVYIDIAIDGKESRRLKNYLPGLYKFIMNNYLIFNRVGPFFLLKPRSLAESALVRPGRK